MLGYARILQTARGDLYDNPLRVGEVVRLRSGGNLMTVVEFADGGKCKVVWQDQLGVVHGDQFGPELLERAKARRSFFGLRR